MASNVLRFAPVPSARDPALLLRLIAEVASGTRQPDALSAALAIGLSTAQDYIDAGIWLGLLVGGAEVRLTQRGMALAFADVRKRRRLLAEAIWQTPDAVALLGAKGELPALDTMVAWVLERRPGLSPERARRQADATRALMAPALEHRPTRRTPRGDQLTLPFRPSSLEPSAMEPAEGGDPFAADEDLQLRQALLDHGELSLTAVAAGAPPGSPIGALIDAALATGIAVRMGEVLVPGPGLAEGLASESAFPDRPFLLNLDVAGLPLAFPSSLAGLSAGLGVLNAAFRSQREAPDAQRSPTAIDARVRVHGGLLHPGERPPRLIPDALSLRLRALTHAPAFAMLGALLLLDRREGGRLRVERRGSAPELVWKRRPLGGVLAPLAAFAAAQGWCLARPPSGGLSDEALIAAAEAIGIADFAGSRVILDEALFLRMEKDVEANLVLEALDPLAARLRAWLDAL